MASIFIPRIPMTTHWMIKERKENREKIWTYMDIVFLHLFSNYEILLPKNTKPIRQELTYIENHGQPEKRVSQDL